MENSGGNDSEAKVIAPPLGTPLTSITQPKKLMFGLRSYLILTIVLGILSCAINYYVTIKAFPTAFPIAPMYFAMVLPIFLFAEGLLMAFGARMAKVANRTWDKAFFAAIGSNFLYALFSLIGLPFVKSNQIIALALSLFSAVLAWFLLKRVYETSNKTVGKIVLWSAIVIGGLAFIAGVIGIAIFASKLTEMGI